MYDRVSIASALMLMHSFVYNPRRTEDLTHPLWDRLVNQWCEQVSRSVHPTPQLKLYTSPLDKAADIVPNPDPDLEHIISLNASTRTIADPKAQGVITDFSALMPLISSRDSPGVTYDVAALQAVVENDENGTVLQNLRLLKVFVLTLIELKRPVSRSIVGLPKFIRALCRSMEHARIQVATQAGCLFGTPKYATQQSVIVVAAVGEWWSTRIITRKRLTTEFSIVDYKIVLEKLEGEEQEDEKDEKLQGDIPQEKEDLDDLIVSLDEVKSTFASVEEKESQFEKKRKKELNYRRIQAEALKRDHNRQERASRRNARREQAEKEQRHEQRLIDLLYQFDPQLATDDILGELSQLWKASTSSIKEGVDIADYTAGTIPKDGITRESLMTHWSGLMKVGSNVSNAYMEFIKSEFNKAVEDKEC